jgi:energy-coupling factor transporter ATP-binding protein EcfA2
MRIAQATTMHWGGLPNMDYAFGGHTLLAGETGSGKTSLIDAIVAVMAGGDSRKSKFNTAQTQSTPSAKKSKRTIASYITGSNGMGRFLRPNGAHGYVCVAWIQDEGDGPFGIPFTAIIGGEASLDRDVEKTPSLSGELVRILVRGHIVGHGDLMSPSGTVMPGHDLVVALRAKYGTAAVRDFKTGGEYLAMLYAFLKGDTTPVSREEADAAIKAFVSAIAYRQPNDIDGLIREEILDPVDNDALIQRLMETIREVNRLKTEAARMEANIAQLEAAEVDLRSAFSAFMQERMARALIEVRRVRDIGAQADAKFEERRIQADDLRQTEAAILAKNKDIQTLEGKHSDIQARIAKEDVYATKTNLERLIAEQDREMASILARVQSTEQAFKTAEADVTYMEGVVGSIDDLTNCASMLSGLRAALSSVSLPALQAAIEAVRDGLGEGPLQAMLEQCTAMRTALTETWAQTVNGETGLRSAFNRSFRATEGSYDAKAEEARSILRRVEKLKVGQIEYPEPVEYFLPLLQAQLPECKPRVLCDVVEVTKPEWQPAIEGYLGLDRYTILYDRKYETKVVDLAKAFRRDNPGRRGNISVPQLSLAIEDHPHVDQASIVHVISVSSDAEAEGYLKARYGRTLMVRDTGTLRRTRSGIMQDGWSTQGYRYQQRLCLEEDLVFGAEIRRKQRETLLRRGEQLKKEIDALTVRKTLLAKAIEIPGPSAILLQAHDPRLFDEAASLRRMASDELAGLDLSTIATLIKQAQDIERDLQGLRSDVFKLGIHKGSVQTVVDGLDNQLAELHEHLADVQPKAEAETALYRVLMERAFIDRDEWEKRFEKEFKEPWSVDTYTSRRNDQATNATNSTNETILKLNAYKHDALDYQQLNIQPFAYHPSFAPDTVVFWMEDTWRQIREQMRAQRDTGLPERKRDCDIAERSFTSSFTTDFCSTVLSNVEGRDDTILALNTNLSRINFGGDSYFLITALKPEYGDYIELFRKIRSLAEVRRGELDLFNTDEFNATERDTLQRIRDLLLDDRDTEQALIELRRIADYRNYRSYDFERRRGEDRVELSRWGTGSGGETETPVYVIRVAVMASAFKIFSQQKKAHFRSIFMDEVFSTMDEARTRRVIGFLKELRLQIVCAAPTRSMAAVLDEFDTRINFSRYQTAAGDSSDVNVIDLDKARVGALYKTHRENVSASAAEAFERNEPPVRVIDAEPVRTVHSGSS